MNAIQGRQIPLLHNNALQSQKHPTIAKKLATPQTRKANKDNGSQAAVCPRRVEASFPLTR